MFNLSSTALLLSSCLFVGQALADSPSGSDFANYYQKALVQRGVENSTAGFVRALSDPDETQRMYAALALGERRDAASVGALTAALGDGAENVRFHVARSLVMLGSSAGAEVLRQSLTSSANAHQAVEAAGLLAERGDLSGYPHIAEVLRSGDPSVQMRAVIDLLKFRPFDGQTTAAGPVNVVALLSALIESSAVSAVRVNAIYALARTGDRRALATLTTAKQSADVPVSKAANVAIAMIDAKR